MPRNSKLLVIGEKFLFLNGGTQNSKSIVETQDKSFLVGCIIMYSLFLSRPLAPPRKDWLRKYISSRYTSTTPSEP